MIDQTTETFRSSIRTAIEMAPNPPELSPQPQRRPVVRPSLAVAAGFAAVIVILGITAMVFVQTPGASPSATNQPVDTSADTETDVTSGPEPATLPDFPVNVTLVRSGGSIAELVGIRLHEIVTSNDNGATWATFYSTSGQIDALDVASDGSIVAVETFQGSVRGAIASQSLSNTTPRVHTYSPATGTWTVAELPRPAFEEAGQRVGWVPCELMGVEDYVSPTSVAAGPTVAILAGHAMTDRGSCGGGSFLWTTTDGAEWRIEQLQEGLELNGMAWADGAYVGYGSGERWYEFELWESPNLIDWSPARFDIATETALKDTPIASSSGAGGINYAGPIPLGTGMALVFPVQELVIEIPDDLATIDDLRTALEGDPSLLSTVERDVKMLGITFPPTPDQLGLLRSYYEGESNTIDRVMLVRAGTGIWKLAQSD